MKTSEIFASCQKLLAVTTCAFCSYKYYKIIKNSYDYKIIGYNKLRPVVGLFFLHFLTLMGYLITDARQIYRNSGKK